MTLPGQNHNEPKKSERYTPPWIVELARTAMDGIDLDPCSCEEAQRVVHAKEYYSLEKGQDGLALPWIGRVFVNPPGGLTSKRESSVLVWFERFNEYSRFHSGVFVGFNLQHFPLAAKMRNGNTALFWYVTIERPHYYEPGCDPLGRNHPYGHSWIASTEPIFSDRLVELEVVRP